MSFFFLFQDPTQDVILYAEAPIGWDRFLDSPCFWWVLVWEFVECPSAGLCLMFFSWLDWAFVFREEDDREKGSFSLNHIKAACCQHGLSRWMLIFDTWQRWCLSGFLTGKLLPHPSLFPSIVFRRKKLCSPHWRKKEVCWVWILS